MTQKTNISAEERHVPGVYDLAILRQVQTAELDALATQLDAAQEVFHARGTLICNWLAVQCRQLAGQRADDAKEERSWELPRYFYTRPATLAKALRELYTIRDLGVLTAGQIVIVSAVMRDLLIFADHYLTNYDDRG